MPSSITKIGIINRALQMLGSAPINSINENSRGARAMNRAYDSVLLAELYSNVWNFSIKRAQLPADATAPIFGKNKQYPLPGDFLFLAPEETTLDAPRIRDWTIEAGKILTDEASPIDVRYVSSNITESDFDPLFAEAFSAKLAMETCEEITNSNTKLQALLGLYDLKIKSAKKRNAIQNAPVKTPIQSWLGVRI